MTLDEAVAWMPTIVDTLSADLHPMARMISSQFDEMSRRLTQLGLGYLSLDRAGSTLSTGERQRVQLARAVRNERVTTSDSVLPSALDASASRVKS